MPLLYTVTYCKIFIITKLQAVKIIDSLIERQKEKEKKNHTKQLLDLIGSAWHQIIIRIKILD